LAVALTSELYEAGLSLDVDDYLVAEVSPIDEGSDGDESLTDGLLVTMLGISITTAIAFIINNIENPPSTQPRTHLHSSPKTTRHEVSGNSTFEAQLMLCYGTNLKHSNIRESVLTNEQVLNRGGSIDGNVHGNSGGVLGKSCGFLNSQVHGARFPFPSVLRELIRMIDYGAQK
jgi:hypothetical protein